MMPCRFCDTPFGGSSAPVPPSRAAHGLKQVGKTKYDGNRYFRRYRCQDCGAICRLIGDMATGTTIHDWERVPPGPMGRDSQLFAALAATIAATLFSEQPSWLHDFEEVADKLAAQRETSPAEHAQFRTGLDRCRGILQNLGFDDPPTEQLLLAALFAAQGLAFARSLRTVH